MCERTRAVAGEEKVRAALNSIGAQARLSNLGRADHIDAALDRLETGTLTADGRELAIRSAHQLAGSAGTFGLRPASTLASWFEQFFTAVDGAASPEEQRRALNGDLASARVQLAELRTRLDDRPDFD